MQEIILLTAYIQPEKIMRYQKTLSRIINELFDVRTRSDYDDFFVISKAEVEEQVKNAEVFLSAIKKYLSALE